MGNKEPTKYSYFRHKTRTLDIKLDNISFLKQIFLFFVGFLSLTLKEEYEFKQRGN